VEKTVAGYYSNQMDALIMSKELVRSPTGRTDGGSASP